MYATEDDVTIISATVTNESILVVDGNLTVSEFGNLTAEDNLDVHVHGDLILNHDATLGAEDFDATQTTVFVDGNVTLGNGTFEGEPAELTGLVYATHSTMYVDDTATVNGGVIVQQLTSISHQGGQNADELSVNFHEELQDERSPYAVDGNSFETPDKMNENRPAVHDFDIRISEIDTD